MLPTAEPAHNSSSMPFTPSAPPSTPEESPIVRLTYGSKKLHNIIFEENGIPTLDLHGMTVLEARSATQGFLHRQRALGSAHIQIITGRGQCSDEREAKIKSVIKSILLGEGLRSREIPNGGAQLIYL